MKYTIDEYSKQFKMSMEMIQSKIKSKKLNYEIQDNVIYIITPDEVVTTKVLTDTQIVSNDTKKPTVSMIISLYQKENKQLKEKIVQLESKIDQLISDKEQMLKDERDKIEQLYTTKDEQLKNILELINAQMAMQKTSKEDDIKEIKTIDVVEETKVKTPKIIELKEYLKTLDLKQSQRKIIKKRFLSVYNSDVRIIQQNGKLYIDISKYDYSDLLKI